MLIAIGDSHQSIYGFRGASPTSMAEFKEEFKCNELPLSICYRCSEAVVNNAKEIVPHIEPRQGANEGYVDTINRYEMFDKVQNGDYILCRNNAPLVKVFFDIFNYNKTCHIYGKDSGEKICSYVKQIKDFSEQGMAEWIKKREDKLWKANKKNELKEFRDLALMLTYFYKHKQPSSKTVFTEYIEMAFAPNGNSIRLSTVHKVKGMEAPNVFLIEPDLLLPDRNKLDEWEILQEKNLHYVAKTRAINNLYYVY